MGNGDQHVLRTRFEGLDVQVSEDSDVELRLTVDSARALTLLKRLREDPETSMRRLVDLTAIDRGSQGAQEARFEIVYRLQAPGSNARLRVHVPVGSTEPTLDSAVTLWPAAAWLEREVFDLFGIRFRGHPDLRRILLGADFEGAPLRKDFPRQPNLALPKEAGC
jgi:NADH:ubiquinone oxidoreductase subunit C